MSLRDIFVVVMYVDCVYHISKVIESFCLSMIAMCDIRIGLMISHLHFDDDYRQQIQLQLKLDGW